MKEMKEIGTTANIILDLMDKETEMKTRIKQKEEDIKLIQEYIRNHECLKTEQNKALSMFKEKFPVEFKRAKREFPKMRFRNKYLRGK